MIAAVAVAVATANAVLQLVMVLFCPCFVLSTKCCSVNFELAYTVAISADRVQPRPEKYNYLHPIPLRDLE